MAGPGNTELPLHQNGVPEKEPGNNEEHEIRDYVRRTLQVTKTRFFDTGLSATLALTDPQYNPGYISLVAVTSPASDMEVVVSQNNGLTSRGGLVSEDIGGQEIHISYRQLKGNRAVPGAVRRKINGYEYGVIGLPWKDKPYSLKSTMRPHDVKNWEEGDTAPAVSIGFYPGQRQLQPTKADYEAILDTVTRGTRSNAVTENSVQNLIRINIGHKLGEKKLSDAQADIEDRNEEIMRGEALAVQSAEDARLLLEQANVVESDHASEQSFSIGEQRLRELAGQFSGQDATVINHAADQLASMGASINMVRTLLESDDPRVKEALRNLTRERTEVRLTPDEMYSLTQYIAANWEFAKMKKNSGFIDGVIYGIGLGGMDKVSASQEAKVRTLEALEFLRPGETLTQRMDRIAGFPDYQRTRTGQDTGVVSAFRHNPNTGESIIWDPYWTKAGKSTNIRITSPLFGPFFIAMVNVDLQITNDGRRDRLEPTTGQIDYITCRFEGGVDNHEEDIGNAMMRLSKKFPSDKIPQLLIG